MEIKTKFTGKQWWSQPLYLDLLRTSTHIQVRYCILRLFNVQHQQIPLGFYVIEEYMGEMEPGFID